MNQLSIITTTYNSADTLAGCIKSVHSQTQSVEHIIIDGASSDATPVILDQYKDHLAQIVSEPDRGMYDGLNKGIKLATGEIIGLLHADDFYPSNDILEKVIDAFKDTDVEACYGDLVYVYRKDLEKLCATGYQVIMIHKSSLMARCPHIQHYLCGDLSMKNMEFLIWN